VVGIGSRRTKHDRVQVTRMRVQGDADTPFSVVVEPEAMSYDFPPQERVLLTFLGPAGAAQFEVVHGPDYLTIWRPPDTEVWTTLVDGTHEHPRELPAQGSPDPGLRRAPAKGDGTKPKGTGRPPTLYLRGSATHVNPPLTG
jgi:hypothetical protein